MLIWIRGDLAKENRARVRSLESALRRSETDVYYIKAKSYVEFEEVDDEGACYAFEIDDGRLLFVIGQDFYRARTFPSLEFSLVNLLDERDQTILTFVAKGASATPPVKILSADQKRRLPELDHLEIVSGDARNIERLLA